MQFNTAGITFSIKDNPEIGQLKPKGKVTFFKETDNKFDPNAVAILYNSVKIGYVPGKMNKNWKHKEGKVVSYAYMEDGVFNEKDKGVLQSVTIGVDEQVDIETMKFGDELVTYEPVTHTYTDKKGILLSASKLASQLYQDFDRLIMWAFDQGSYEGYKKELNRLADKGTDVHDICEKAIRGEKVDHKVMNFIKDHSPKFISAEEVVYNKDMRVIGRYDAFVEIKGKKILIDWKNGNLRAKYWVQLGFYAKSLGADEMWVVSFKTKNKKGYSVSKKTDINHWYEIGKLLSKVYYLINK